MSFLITQGYLGNIADVVLQGYGIGVAPPPPPPTPQSGAAQGGGFPTGNLVDLVLGKNLKRGKPYKHKTHVVYRLQISTKITILGAANEKPRVIRRRRVERQVVCPVPLATLMEIDEDLFVAELARRSRDGSI